LRIGLSWISCFSLLCSFLDISVTIIKNPNFSVIIFISFKKMISMQKKLFFFFIGLGYLVRTRFLVSLKEPKKFWIHKIKIHKIESFKLQCLTINSLGLPLMLLKIEFFIKSNFIKSSFYYVSVTPLYIKCQVGAKIECLCTGMSTFTLSV
jgi:hypothetical protein